MNMFVKTKQFYTDAGFPFGACFNEVVEQIMKDAVMMFVSFSVIHSKSYIP